jgi:hypothetical protein
MGTHAQHIERRTIEWRDGGLRRVAYGGDIEQREIALPLSPVRRWGRAFLLVVIAALAVIATWLMLALI